MKNRRVKCLIKYLRAQSVTYVGVLPWNIREKLNLSSLKILGIQLGFIYFLISKSLQTPTKKKTKIKRVSSLSRWYERKQKKKVSWTLQMIWMFFACSRWNVTSPGNSITLRYLDYFAEALTPHIQGADTTAKVEALILANFYQASNQLSRELAIGFTRPLYETVIYIWVSCWFELRIQYLR